MLPGPLDAAQLRLAWDLPTSYADGTPLNDVTGCRVYYGTVSQDYSQVVDVPDGVSQCTATRLVDGAMYFFAVTAYDSALRESGYSQELVWGQLNLSAPIPE